MSPKLHIAAQMHFEAEFGEHSGFDAAGAMGLLLVGRVDDLDVIGFVAGHHLVAADAIEHCMHDRPLRSRFAPAPFGFLLREADDF